MTLLFNKFGIIELDMIEHHYKEKHLTMFSFNLTFN
jgi:hypothetical protein